MCICNIFNNKKKKKIIFFTLLIMTLMFLIFCLYKTYATEMSINNNLAFNINNTSQMITLNPNEKREIVYQINNDNNGNLQYGIMYNNYENILIKYNASNDTSKGIIKKGETKLVFLQIVNTNKSSAISFNIKTIFGFEKGGNLEDILPSSYVLVEQKITEYTIIYNVNGGNYWGNKSQIKQHDKNINLINDIPVRNGYEFLGWSTNPSDVKPQYHSGQNISINSSMTLYAIWKKNNALLSDFNYTGSWEKKDDGNGNYKINFLSSGTLTLNNDANVDIFLVGGGGGGASSATDGRNGGGGGGGNVTTIHNAYLSSNNSYYVNVGNGGVIGGNGSPSSIEYNSKYVYDDSNTVAANANGGLAGELSNGGSGGSGGGAGSYYHTNKNLYRIENGGKGGTNGSNGETVYSRKDSNGIIHVTYYGGDGQVPNWGYNTKEFGLESGKLYSGGGGGGAGWRVGNPGVGGEGGGGKGAFSKIPAVAGTPNTGGGGGGGCGGTGAQNGAQGGSGIVVMVNAEQIVKVSFNLNGLSNMKINSISKKNNEIISIPNIKPTSDKYDFLGWSTSNNSNKVTYQPNDKIDVDYDITLYAVWKAKFYTGEMQRINYSNGNYKIKFLSSGTLRLTDDLIVDVFLVGGGGAGGLGDKNSGYDGGGGGGGYTTTLQNVQLYANRDYNIKVGNGGVGTNNIYYSSTAGEESNIKYNGNYITVNNIQARAAGGQPGFGNLTNDSRTQCSGGNGGSGGGAGGHWYGDKSTGANKRVFPSNGASNGENAETKTSTDKVYKCVGGQGQVNTTREFGESNGTLYSGGGGGAYRDNYNFGQGGDIGGGQGSYNSNIDGQSGVSNTGGGGGGSSYNGIPGNGGSGIVIIRYLKGNIK